MTTTSISSRRLLAALTIAAAAISACSRETTPPGVGNPQLSAVGDTVLGTGQLAELLQRRAAWIARGIVDYQVQLRISCFCAPDLRRPVLVEVRGGTVAKVSDLETNKPVTTLSNYPSITKLFDMAIAERSGGGYVAVVYDRTYGFPARIEIGTLANDAGTEYALGAFRPL